MTFRLLYAKLYIVISGGALIMKEKQVHASKRIKIVMKERNLAQSDIVRLALDIDPASNLNRTNISAYIKGLYEPADRKRYVLAKVLNVSEDWLMGYKAPRERKVKTPEVLTLYNKLDQPRQMEVLEHIKFKLDEQEQEQSLVADPEWKAVLTDRDRKIISLKVRQVMEGYGSDDLMKASMDGRDGSKFSDDDSSGLVEAAMIEVFEDIMLERKEKYTPKKHKTKKEGS